jgi:hypothetical protein
VTDKLIAMPLPGQGLEAKQYNDAEEVSRVFHTLHISPKGPAFLIVNLCAERSYNPSLFSGQVLNIPSHKDGAPGLEKLCKLVEHANEWHQASPENVLAMHDMAGLTRTGIFIVCWLIYSGFASASSEKLQDAMDWFCFKRLGREKDEQLVYSPSQRRYMDYFRQVVDKGGYSIPGICLEKIILWTVPDMNPSGGCCPWFVITQEDKEVFDYSKYHQINNISRGRDKIVFECDGCQLRGDFKVTFYDHKQDDMMIDEMMFFVMFHSGFVTTSNLVVPLCDVDGASADVKNTVFHPNFRIELIFAGDKRSKGVWRKLDAPAEFVLDEAQESSARLRANMILGAR